MARGGSVLLLLLIFLVPSAALVEKREPPKILEPNVAREEFHRHGETITLKCKANGTPAPLYSWYWNSKLYKAGNNPDISFDALSGTLTIQNLDENNEGFFRCHASNKLTPTLTAVAVSPKIEVRKGRIMDFPEALTKSSVMPNPVENSYYALPCDDRRPETYGRTEFVWYRVTAAAVQSQLPLDSRMFTDGNGTLHFSFLRQSDGLDGDYYACALSNAVDGNIRVGSQKKLTVNAGSSVGFAPAARFPPPSTTVTFKRNSEAKLECFFSGRPAPTVAWQFANGTYINTGGRFLKPDSYGRRLVIQDLRLTDEGTYRCIGSNSPQSTATATVFLNVTSAPIFEKGKRLVDTTVTELSNATLHCHAQSATTMHDEELPPQKPRWYMNGAPFNRTNEVNKFKFSDNGRTLTVFNVKKNQDIACYQCYVDNSVGEAFSDGCLNIILPIEILSQPKARWEIKEGDVVNLTVTAVSDPLYPLQYKWVFKNKTYIDPDHPPYLIFNPLNGSAILNTTGYNNTRMHAVAGTYYRIVHNPVQNKTVTIEVVWVDEPIVVPVVEAGFDFWIIGLIIGILIIILVIIIIICVCRRKMLEGDYPLDRKETQAGLDPEKELKDSGFHDLSRADYDYLPEKKPLGDIDFDENIPLNDDESFGEEYGEEAQAFNEDGSFIGVYSKTKKEPPPPGYQQQSGESNV